MSNETTVLGITEQQWQEALTREAERVRVVRLTCDHSDYSGFTIHGRCCPCCGIFMVDFGD